MTLEQVLEQNGTTLDSIHGPYFSAISPDCPILPAHSSREQLMKLADLGKLIRGNANRGYYDPQYYSGSCKSCGREVIITVHTGDGGLGYSVAHYDSPEQRAWITSH